MLSDRLFGLEKKEYMNNFSPIYVTQPSLPPLHELLPYLEEIWKSKILTNGGPFHQQLERALCEYLGVEYISLFSNGTLALITALRALDITGEVVTTPYSFVATAHSLLWNGIQPVFSDIDPESRNLDPSRIEAAITENTRAILPVHCYGYPCDTAAIGKIAAKRGVKVIYDAAHAFGVRHNGQSILRAGDLSVLSFHATKVFSTFEGGAIVCGSAEMKEHIDQLKNFGITDEVSVAALGINGKMCELNAAIGLLQLRYVDGEIARREEIDRQYRSLLSHIPGISCVKNHDKGITPNYSYFPILVESTYPISRDQLYEKLRSKNIFTRRYFYPLISEFPMYRDIVSSSPNNLPVATVIASKILCLPMYANLTDKGVISIVGLIGDFYNRYRHKIYQNERVKKNGNSKFQV
jgi:dTDP-4-amino-4,6-dideoxygalactose transaminase